tara:strand:+ start:811 stop:1230 length:420 start_codon:yes stop_codon:yes gene_type:complete
MRLQARCDRANIINQERNIKMEYNSDFGYDLAVGQMSEKALGNIFENKKIEVKRDLMAIRTGNLFIEYESRGQPSGIVTSKAEYYCFDIGDIFILLEKSKLMDMVMSLMGTGKDIRGGDNNTSKGVLLPLNALIRGNEF